MSWPPPPSKKAQELGGGIFFGLMSRAMAALTPDRPLVPLHLGDSHLPPPDPVAIPAPSEALHRYGPIAGDADLIKTVAAKLRDRNGLNWAYDSREIQITCGATNALSSTLLALSDPGDEVLIPSPFWPLIRGITRTASCVPVEIPMLDHDGNRAALPDRFAGKIGPKTKFLYVSSPNNPDGHVTPREELEAVVQLARARGLWILSDEVYEDLVYDGNHVSIASLPGASAQTVSVWSFSKSYAQAGLRVGYVCAPGDAINAIRRIVTHTVYNPPVEMQRAAHGSLAAGPPKFNAPFRALRDLAVAALAPVAGVRAPMAGTFLFMDLDHRYGKGTLEKLADAGVLLAPGDAFGEAYGGWARLCYTAIPGDVLAAGLARMCDVLG